MGGLGGKGGAGRARTPPQRIFLGASGGDQLRVFLRYRLRLVFEASSGAPGGQGGFQIGRKNIENSEKSEPRGVRVPTSLRIRFNISFSSDLASEIDAENLKDRAPTAARARFFKNLVL